MAAILDVEWVVELHTGGRKVVTAAYPVVKDGVVELKNTLHQTVFVVELAQVSCLRRTDATSTVLPAGAREIDPQAEVKRLALDRLGSRTLDVRQMDLDIGAMLAKPALGDRRLVTGFTTAGNPTPVEYVINSDRTVAVFHPAGFEAVIEDGKIVEFRPVPA